MSSQFSLDKVAGSGKDEFYTPQYAIDPILKYIPNSADIWCPFDTSQSLFVKSFIDRGNTVTASHINDGFDFFDVDIPDGRADYIVSNPQYSIKTQVFARLFELGRPFAMLVGVVGLFESKARFDMFSSNDIEVMYFNKRISYFESYDDPKPKLNPPFSSVYLCHKVLPETLMFEEIEK